MIVLDASAIVELLTDARGLASGVRAELEADAHWVIAEHTVIETASALRGLWLADRIDDDDFDVHLASIARMRFDVHDTTALLPRIRALASNATAYDAAYLAIAESLDAPLITTDAKLGGVPGSAAVVRVVG